MRNVRSACAMLVLVGALVGARAAVACKLARSRSLGPPSPSAKRVAAMETMGVRFGHELGFFGCGSVIHLEFSTSRTDVIGAIVRGVSGTLPAHLGLGGDVLAVSDGGVVVSASTPLPVWGELSVEWVLADGSITAPTRTSVRSLGVLPWVAGALGVGAVLVWVLRRRLRASERALRHIRGG